MASKIGILGSGAVGQTLAAGFARHGHAVTIGSREPAKLADWSAKSGVPTASVEETARFGEILVLAVAGKVAEQALGLAGAANLAGKVIIDTTNPIAAGPPQGGVIQYFTGPNDSLMERLQRAFPAGRFVKAFNSVGNAFMVDPKFPGGRPTMFICGNDAAAKTEVSSILEKFGWDTADMGPVEGARAIEPLCQLWCIPGMLRGKWSHAFKLLEM
jgi:predicted dinucleotide-binding enzyme